MKDHWEKMGTELHNFKEQLENLLNILPQSAKIYTAQNAIIKQWKKVQRAADEMDPFIAPVKSVEVISKLFTDADFNGTWQMWKDYLVEQHGIYMRSRAELMALKRMAEISDNNPATAVKYLEYYMGRMDKGGYKPNDTEETATKENKTGGGTVVKIPAKYHQKTIEEEIENNQ